MSKERKCRYAGFYLFEMMLWEINLLCCDCKWLISNDSRKYPHFKEMVEKLKKYQFVLDLVEKLTDRSFKKRHWEQLFKLVGRSVPFDSETFTLKDFFDFDPLSIKKQI